MQRQLINFKEKGGYFYLVTNRYILDTYVFFETSDKK